MINIILAGVGGQGTVLAAKVLAMAAASKGWMVRTAETIGMSQRGGSVVSHVRIANQGEDIHASLVTRGTANLIIAFEPGEGARVLPYLARSGTLITASTPIEPVSSSLTMQRYDAEEILENIRVSLYNTMVRNIKKSDSNSMSTATLITVDDAAVTRALGGNRKVLNSVMLARAVKDGCLPFTFAELCAAIEACVKPAFVKMNLQAVEAAVRMAKMESRKKIVQAIPETEPDSRVAEKEAEPADLAQVEDTEEAAFERTPESEDAAEEAHGPIEGIAPVVEIDVETADVPETVPEPATSAQPVAEQAAESETDANFAMETQRGPSPILEAEPAPGPTMETDLAPASGPEAQPSPIADSEAVHASEQERKPVGDPTPAPQPEPLSMPEASPEPAAGMSADVEAVGVNDLPSDSQTLIKPLGEGTIELSANPLRTAAAADETPGVEAQVSVAEQITEIARQGIREHSLHATEHEAQRSQSAPAKDLHYGTIKPLTNQRPSEPHQKKEPVPYRPYRAHFPTHLTEEEKNERNKGMRFVWPPVPNTKKKKEE